MTDSTISASEPAAVTLQFPAGPTTATLTFFPSREEVAAEGAVTVPAGTRRTQLVMAANELAVLSRLAPGDIHSLRVRDPTLALVAALAPLGFSALALEGECEPGVIAELAGLDTLTDFTLQDVVLDPQSAAALAGLSRVTWLRLLGESTPEAAAGACRLTQLDHLSLHSSAALGSGLGAIGDLVHLEQLILLCPDLGDGVAARLGGLRELSTLMLGTSGVRGAGMDVLAALPKLNFLAISSPEFELSALELLKGSPSLTQLSITGAAGINDSAAPLIAALSPPLTQVSLSPDSDEEGAGLSVSAQVWLKRSRPELSVNGFDPTEKALAKYLAAGLGTHPVTGGEELAP